MTFKETVADDVHNVFMNPEEFSEIHSVNGKEMPVQIDSIEQIERLCNRVLWLEKGKMRMLGEMQPVCDAYKAIG